MNLHLYIPKDSFTLNVCLGMRDAKQTDQASFAYTVNITVFGTI